MWLAIFGISFAVLILGIVYMMFAVSKFPLIKRVTAKKRIFGLMLSLLVIAAFLFVMTLLTSFINSAVIFLHLLLFMLLFSFIGWLLKKLINFHPEFNFQALFAVLTCAVYLTTAFFLCKNVWLENYSLSTDKNVGTIKVAVFADSHLGTTFDGEGFEKLMKKIEAQSPDVLLIPGDFVDDGTSREDLVKACSALGNIKTKYGVYYAYGNHDRGYYRDESSSFTEADLINELQKNNVTILQDDYILIDDRFYIVGREDASRRDRAAINDLLKDLDTDKYIIVMDHQPNDYGNESSSSADLVISGHTHGGQLFPITHVGEVFGINDKTYGYERVNNTDFIVTSGISDWEILFKTGTKSEYLIIDINGR